MLKELDSMESHDVKELVDLPPGAHAIGTTVLGGSFPKSLMRTAISRNTRPDLLHKALHNAKVLISLRPTVPSLQPPVSG